MEHIYQFLFFEEAAMTSRLVSVPVLVETLENRMMLSAASATSAGHLLLQQPATDSVHHANLHTKPAHLGAKKTAHVALNGDPIFMQFEGIDGAVSVKGFAKDIELLSFSFGVSRGVSSPTAGAINREASAPTISEITVTKKLDKTSPKLLQQALDGTGKTVTIFFVNIEDGKATTYAKYVLSNVLVSAYSVSSGSDHPTESISLNFTKVEFTSFIKTSAGSITPVEAGWDLTAQRSV
jgi:type VI secretion system secreted protein Hcp